MNVWLKNLVYFVISTISMTIMITCEKSLGLWGIPIVLVVAISCILLLQGLIISMRPSHMQTSRERLLVIILIVMAIALAIIGEVMQIVVKVRGDF